MHRLSISKPNVPTLECYLQQQAELDFSYADVGATAHDPPAGFVVDHTRIDLGQGEAVFQAGKAALRRWEQFRLGWVDAWNPECPLQQGNVVAVMGWAVGLWWLNACRIIYTIDEDGPHVKFGFAYGTLPGHFEAGEERFLLDWDRETDLVSYDILAFSRPNHFLTRLGYLAVRRSQKRFGRDSATAMMRAANPGAEIAPILQSTR